MSFVFPKKFYSSDGWRKIRINVMNPIIIVRVCKKCEKEIRRMENNDLNIDEIVKIMAEAVRRLTESLSSFNEEKIKEILKQSIKPTLSEAERVILENIDKDYKWIARDRKYGLYVYHDKPKREGTMWIGSCGNFNAFNHLFQFIKWEDEEPYNIEELLKQ